MYIYIYMYILVYMYIYIYNCIYICRNIDRSAPTRFFKIFAAELAGPGVVPWPQRPDAAAPLQPGQLMQVVGINHQTVG